MRLQSQSLDQQLGLMKDSIELTDRPWVSVEVTPNTEYVPGAIIGGPLTFDADGNGGLTYRVKMTNAGHSVAANVELRAKVFPMAATDRFDLPEKEQSKVCEENKPQENSIHAGPGHYAIFPNNDYRIEFGREVFSTKDIFVNPQLFPNLKSGKPLFLFVLGCVRYTYKNATHPHATGFIFEVKGARGQAIQTKRNVAVKDLEFEKYFTGDFAY